MKGFLMEKRNSSGACFLAASGGSRLFYCGLGSLRLPSPQ